MDYMISLLCRLVNLWGFGPDKFIDIPTTTNIDSVLAFVGQDLIEVESK